MGDTSVILEGLDSEDSRQAMYSTVHGAGRVMSRTKAAGKARFIKGVRTRLSAGVVDWDRVRGEMKSKGIELRGGAPDEAPEVYKSLSEVLGHHERTVKVLHQLRPIGVAMAGEDIIDPYKD